MWKSVIIVLGDNEYFVSFNNNSIIVINTCDNQHLKIKVLIYLLF